MKLVKQILKLITRLFGQIIIIILPEGKANLVQTGMLSWNKYFSQAERTIQTQWDNIIWPLIQNMDFHDTLELSPGAGRNTERLCSVSNRLYAVDYSANAISKCRKRLGVSFRGCQIYYYTNNGKDLRMIDSDSISTIYCWDSAVHFNKIVLEGYIKEFSRVLKQGGKGFVHHSNLGNTASRNIKDNPHWRSNVSKEYFSEKCIKYGLVVETQIDIPWGKIIDCVSIFSK